MHSTDEKGQNRLGDFFAELWFQEALQASEIALRLAPGDKREVHRGEILCVCRRHLTGRERLVIVLDERISCLN